MNKQEKYIDFFKNSELNIEFENVNCPNHCNNDKIITNKDIFGCENIEYAICKSCGLIRSKNFLTDTSLESYYINHYYKVFEEDYFPNNIKKFYEIQNIQSKDRWGKILKFYGEIKKTTTVLDYGGLSGGLLNDYIDKCDVYLCDYAPDYISYAKKKGINTVTGDIKSVLKLKKKFDIVFLNQTMEHIKDLNSFFKNLREIVNYESVIYIDVPSLEYQKFQNLSVLQMFFFPHIYFFSIHWLNKYIQSKGFRVLYYDITGSFVLKKNNNFLNKKYNFYLQNMIEIKLSNFSVKIKNNKILNKIFKRILKKVFFHVH